MDQDGSKMVPDGAQMFPTYLFGGGDRTNMGPQRLPKSPKIDPDVAHVGRNSTHLPDSNKLEICKKRCVFQYTLSLEIHKLAKSDHVGSKMVPDGAKMFPVRQRSPKMRTIIIGLCLGAWGGKNRGPQRLPKWTHMRHLERQTAPNCHTVENWTYVQNAVFLAIFEAWGSAK